MSNSTVILKEFWAKFSYKLVKCRPVWTLQKSTLRDVTNHDGFISRFASVLFKTDGGLEWYLQIKGRGSENKDVEIRPVIHDCNKLIENDQHLQVNGVISILDRDENVFRKLDFQFSFSKNYSRFDDDRNCPCLNKQDILDNPDIFLPNDQFKILCELSYLVPIKQLNSVSKITSEQMECYQELSHHFANLRSDPNFADVKLCVGSKEFPAQKNILAARSSVFAAMFECDMLEKKQNRVEIEHIKEEILEDMLEFIYTGQAPNLDRNAQELLVAADRYDLAKLKALAESNLASKLSVDNALDQLIFADTNLAERLKRDATNIILSNLGEIRQTPGWNEMAAKNPQMMQFILESVIDKCQEKKISLN